MGLLDKANSMEAGFIADADEHGETVTYTPYGEAALTINIIVDRQADARLAGTTAGNYREPEVFVRNHPSEGVTSVVEKGDTITMPERIAAVGGTTTNKTYIVYRVIDNDANWWHLQLRQR